MDLTKAIEERVSTRSFKSKKVSWKYILDAIEAALHAPFAGNINHLKFIIIENPEIIKKISEYANQIWISEASSLIVICSDDMHLERMYGERGRIYGKQQAGAAIENILLKLTDLKIASCWVGAYTDELVKQLLKIPSHIEIEAIIPIGYSNEKTERKKKRSLESSIYWEDWGRTKRPTISEEPPIINYN